MGADCILKAVVMVVAVVASSSSASPIQNDYLLPSASATVPLTTPARIPSSSTPSSPTQCLPIQPGSYANSAGVTDFGMGVFRQLAKEGNVFFSPFNLWTALSLAYMGAEGETSLQMGLVLGLSGKRRTIDFLNGLEKELSERFAGHQNLSLEAASRVYINKGFPINSCLYSALSSRLKSIDFSKITEAADLINSYVNKTTRGLIPTIISPSDLSQTRMAIISAIYFYGTWDMSFEPRLTVDTPFQRDPNSSRTETVKMMNLKTSLLVGKSSELGARILRLPYVTGTISMYVLLPEIEGQEGFDATLRALNSSSIEKGIGGLTEKYIQVSLPKFKMEAEYGHTMEEALKSLGATHMFDSRLADFSSFSPTVYVSKVAHKAVVDVSEAGTEAAAATAVLIDVRSSRAEAQPFVCDRPFIFLIYDDVSKLPLFVGAYTTPPPA